MRREPKCHSQGRSCPADPTTLWERAPLLLCPHHVLTTTSPEPRFSSANSLEGGWPRPCAGARVTSPHGHVSRAEWPQPCLTPLRRPEIPTHTAESPSSSKPQSYQLLSGSSFLGKVSLSRSHIFGENCRYTECCKGNPGGARRRRHLP